MLAGLPVPLQVIVATALLPYEVAITSVKIMKNTEALLAEMVFHLNALRPAVTSVSQAYAGGQFDQMFRTLDQIQHGTNAFALVWSPLTAVRDRFVPGSAVTVPPPPPPRPRSPYPRQAPPMAIPAPPPAPAPPSTADYLGRLAGEAWDQAASLPGAGLLRRAGRPLAQAWSAANPPPARSAVDDRAEEFARPGDFVYSGDVIDYEEETPAPASSATASLMSLAEPLVPGPIRRLFGGT
jgi:hypothetical protein